MVALKNSFSEIYARFENFSLDTPFFVILVAYSKMNIILFMLTFTEKKLYENNYYLKLDTTILI